MVPRSLRLLSAAALLAVAPAPSRAAEPAGARRVALVLFEKGAPDRALVQGFRAALSALVGRTEAIALVGAREQDERLGPGHVDAVVACGTDLKCVAGFGEKVGAAQVLFGRATAERGDVALQWLLVDVRTAHIVGKLKMKVTAAAGPAVAAAQLGRELLGVAAADSPAPVAAAPAAEVPAPAEPVAASTEPRAKWRAPAIAGTAAVACGALALGAGVLSSRDGEGTRANVFYAAGGALMLGGAGIWIWDSVRVSPVVAVDAKAGYAGLAGTW